MTQRRRQSGQAAVETALTLPLTLFMILGTLQLFTMLQARIMAQYALGRAVRMGSLHHGNCRVMQETAVAALIPTFRPFARPGANWGNRFATAFATLKSQRYRYTNTVVGHNSEVAWLYRDSPAPNSLPADIEETWSERPYTLEARMVFWYPMRIPFANWTIARMVAAHQGLQDFKGYSAFNPAQGANWTKDGTLVYAGAMPTEFLRRLNAGEYVIPIVTSAATRMMTPPRKLYFNGPCPLKW